MEFLATVLGTGGTTTGIEVPAEVVEGAKAAETRARRVAGVVAAVTG